MLIMLRCRRNRRHRRNVSVDPLTMSSIAKSAFEFMPQHRNEKSNPEALASLDAIVGSDEFKNIVGPINLYQHKKSGEIKRNSFEPKPSRRMTLARKRPNTPWLCQNYDEPQIKPDNDVWVETLILPLNFADESRAYFTSRNTQEKVWDEPPSGATRLVRLAESERIYFRVHGSGVENDESCVGNSSTNNSMQESLESPGFYACNDSGKVSSCEKSRDDQKKENIDFVTKTSGFVTWTFDESETKEDNNSAFRNVTENESAESSSGYLVIE